ncbi:MAG: hypothetical protein AAF205_13785, partial [Pseudomonadota bacterium]
MTDTTRPALEDERLENVGAGFIEAMYRRYVGDRDSVDAGWQRYFASIEAASETGAETGGPSWQREGWPVADTDDLTAAL